MPHICSCLISWTREYCVYTEKRIASINGIKIAIHLFKMRRLSWWDQGTVNEFYFHVKNIQSAITFFKGISKNKPRIVQTRAAGKNIIIFTHNATEKNAVCCWHSDFCKLKPSSNFWSLKQVWNWMIQYVSVLTGHFPWEKLTFLTICHWSAYPLFSLV